MGGKEGEGKESAEGSNWRGLDIFSKAVGISSNKFLIYICKHFLRTEKKI